MSTPRSATRALGAETSSRAAARREGGRDEATDRHVTLINLFRRVNRLLAEELYQRLREAGYTDVSRASQAVFENIDRHGTRLTVLAARADMAHPSMNELVNELERQGYVERRPDPTDRRAKLVCLTGQGRQAARDALAIQAQIESDWCARTGTNIDWRASLSRGLAEHER